jgi:ubiquinone biosynthesis protein Coq4
VFHDLGHVLAGYGTDPEGEIQQAAFQSGFVRNDGFAFLFFGIVQFHLGVKLTPIADPEVGFFDVDKVMTALARGAACKIDLSDQWDFWPYMARPLDEVRAALGIPPLAAPIAA